MLPSGPVGVTRVLGGRPVFVKRIPITERELARPRSTANLFGLPVACQYGMYRLPSPGFGAWRELAATEMVSDGVFFPELHHWRVLPGRPPGDRDIDAVVRQFGGDPAVRARLEELAAARSSLVLFLEYLPEPVDTLLADPAGRAPAIERQLFEAVAFLRDRSLLHMDGHLGNMRARGDQLCLVDFGLATSPRFDLSDAERGFVARNAGYDAGYAAMRLVNWLVTTVCGVSADPAVRNEFVRRPVLPPDVPAPVAEIITRHAPAAARMNDFHWRLYAGELPDTGGALGRRT